MYVQRITQCSFPAGIRDISLQSIQTVGASHLAYAIDTAGSFPGGVKWLSYRIDHSLI
jgi:hypothetical protein